MTKPKKLFLLYISLSSYPCELTHPSSGLKFLQACKQYGKILVKLFQLYISMSVNMHTVQSLLD